MASESRKPYLLTVSPINYSLTDGTNIPAPPDSPPPSPKVGPTASSVMPGTFPPSTPERAASTDQQASLSPTDHSHAHPGRADSVATPLSPASLNKTSPANADRRPPGVRRLFSLSSLRQSFSSSRTSLSLAHPETSGGGDAAAAEPDAASMLAARPASRAPSSAATPSVRGKRSNNWFKRKSGFFATPDDDSNNNHHHHSGTLDVVREDGRPDSRDHKRLKPLLPEISNLSGGELDDGKLGWDEQIFKP